MWTATITKSYKDKLYFNFTVDFFRDGILVDTVSFERNSNIESVKPLIKSRLDQYKRIDELDADALIGAVSFDKDESADEVKFNDFQKNLLIVKKSEKAIALGIIQEADESYQNALDFIRDNYQEEYLTLLG